jgi:hypothetical protein
MPASALDRTRTLEGLDRLVAVATAHAALPLDGFAQKPAAEHPGDGRDDMAILALRIPAS